MRDECTKLELHVLVNYLVFVVGPLFIGHIHFELLGREGDHRVVS